MSSATNTGPGGSSAGGAQPRHRVGSAVRGMGSVCWCSVGRFSVILGASKQHRDTATDSDSQPNRDLHDMHQNLTWPDAVQKVLSESATPLHYKEVTNRVIAQRLRTSLGATPAATVNAMMAESIKRQPDKSPYIRVGKGIFTLRAKPPGVLVTSAKLTPEVSESEEIEDQYEVVSSFGMFWRRDAVELTHTPKLLGVQEIGATPVDFNGQLGVYLLYDGREVIYAGRTTDRPLGRRLFEHTHDRMSSRWDRFSWFGLLPVSPEGKLGDLPRTFEAASLIPALEAILIESLEPRQNRKRGDDLESVEYMQYVDPIIEKRRLKAAFDAAIDKS